MQSRPCAAFTVIAIAAVTVLGFCGSAAADDRETCKTASGDVAIEACSRAITSKKFNKRVLSLLYTNRGVEYALKKDFEHAIADHDQAIKVDAKNPVAYNNRGNAYDGKREFDRAIADYDQAIMLNPKYAGALYNRGLAKQKKGDITGGQADIAAAKQMEAGVGQQSQAGQVWQPQPQPDMAQQSASGIGQQ
jgi:tetratricopeptide (TPR) repeat protein